MNRTMNFAIVASNPPKELPCFLENPPCTKPGWAIEFTLTVCSIARINCNFTNHPDRNWTEIQEKVDRGILDATMPTWFPTPARMKRFAISDFSSPQIQVILTRYPEHEWGISLQALFGFTPLVFGLIFLSSILVGTVILLLRKGISRNNISFLPSYIAAATQQLCGQTSNLLSQSGKHYILFCPWMLMSQVLIIAYSGNILSNIMKKPMPFRNPSSFGKCLKERRCELIAKTMDYSYFEEIRAGHSSEMESMRSGIRINPPKLIDPSLNYLQEVQKGAPIFRATIVTQDELLLPQRRDLCNLYTVPWRETPYLYPQGRSFMMTKNHMLLGEVNKALQIMHLGGIGMKILRGYINQVPSPEECLCQYDTQKPIPLVATLPAIFILLFGTSIAFLVFLLELCIAPRLLNIT